MSAPRRSRGRGLARGRPDGGGRPLGRRASHRARPSPTNAAAATFHGRGRSADLGIRRRPIRRAACRRGRRQLRPDIRGRARASLTGHLRFRVRACSAILDSSPPRAAGALRHVRRGGGPHAADDLGGPAARQPERHQRLVPQRDSGGRPRLVVDWACADAGGAGVASCPADETVSAQGAGQRRGPGQAHDRAGNQSATIFSPFFNYDGAAPNTGPMRSPSPGAIVAAEPTFVWGPASGDATSGWTAMRSSCASAGRTASPPGEPTSAA